VLSIHVHDESHIGEARRGAVDYAKQRGFSEEAAGRVAIVATELASNLVKHSKEGTFLCHAVEENGEVGIELASLDKGPGISDVGAALADGYSTAGSMGGGLGAIRRLSTSFAVYSLPTQGTVIIARVMRVPVRGTLAEPSWGAFCQPKRGEEVCGDGYEVIIDANGFDMLVADGLGHGPSAAEASQTALRLFREARRLRPKEALEEIHAGMRATRGAAIAIARWRPDEKKLTFAGIGNVTAAIIADGKEKRLVSHNGTVGHAVRRVDEFEYPVTGENPVVILHSDGLSNSWKFSAYPGLLQSHPSLIAAVLLRDFGRGHDDATILVAKAPVS
jgi:anti-sigma regulatory factor (Ser/Thr protein kinase)